MNFLDEAFLRGHIESILGFYKDRVVDSTGGYFQNFRNDGRLFEPGKRHLVSSCRMVFNFSIAYQLFADPSYMDKAQHGVDYVRTRHWDPERCGYHWTLADGHVPDISTNHCYGLAFVLLSATAAAAIGIDGAVEEIAATYDLLEHRFWDDDAGLYADEATPDWSRLSGYRGQNANMHCCEALIAAYEVTGERRYLQRARDLAQVVVVDLASKSDGMIWEHYTSQLEIDWDYNREDPKNLYRPWGFQPGHQTEWSKLLLQLHGHLDESWLLERAERLFLRAMSIAWDSDQGGIHYGYSPDLQICDSDKYFWVQAETLAAAVRLLAATSNDTYRNWYSDIWHYCWDHFVDHTDGAWYRVLSRDNQPYDDMKATAGGKCDYHTVGACYDILRVLSRTTKLA